MQQLPCPLANQEIIEPPAWDFRQCGMCDQHNLRSACANAQSDQSLCKSLAHSMTAKLLTEHNLEFLRLKKGCTDSSESTLGKIPHCWKLHVAAHIPYKIKVLLVHSMWPAKLLIKLSGRPCLSAYLSYGFVIH